MSEQHNGAEVEIPLFAPYSLYQSMSSLSVFSSQKSQLFIYNTVVKCQYVVK